MASYYTGTGGNDTTGDGLSHATRWLTIQKAIDTMTTGQANRLNVTGSETLSSALDFATRPYTPTPDNWLHIAGYTSVEDDKGVFSLNGGGSEIVTGDAVDNLSFELVKFTNWGASTVFSTDNGFELVNCEFDGEGARAALIDTDNGFMLLNCKIHSMAVSGTFFIRTGRSARIQNNYFQIDSATANDVLIQGNSSEINVSNNVFNIKTNSTLTVIDMIVDECEVVGNSIYNQTEGNGIGITVAANAESTVVLNNIVGGMATGINLEAGSSCSVYGHNKFFSNTADESLSGAIKINLGNNTDLGANPFTSTGNADHNNDDFRVDTTVKALAFPATLYDPGGAFGDRNQNFLDCGALQREEAGGSGAIVNQGLQAIESGITA